MNKDMLKYNIWYLRARKWLHNYGLFIEKSDLYDWIDTDKQLIFACTEQIKAPNPSDCKEVVTKFVHNKKKYIIYIPK